MNVLLESEPRGLLERPPIGRPLLKVGLVPSLATVAALTAGVSAFLLVGGIDPRGAGAVVAATWLAAHQVPLTITGTTLGVLPLLPTAGLVWLTKRSVTATGARGRRGWWVAAAAVAGPVAVAAVALVVLAVARAGLPVAAPSAIGALLRVAAVHALGAALGVARPSGGLAQLRRGTPRWVWLGLVRVPELVVILTAAGTVLTVLALVRGFTRAVTVAGGSGGPGGVIGLVVLSIGYLPNVVVGALSVAVGPGAALGTTTVTAFGAVPGPGLPLPLLAVLPTSSGSWWWPVVLLVPAAVGARLGSRVRRTSTSRGSALRSVGLAALVTGGLIGLLGRVAGGGLGAFTPVGVPALALAAATAAWLGIVGGGMVLVLDGIAHRSTVADGGAGSELGRPDSDASTPGDRSEPRD